MDKTKTFQVRDVCEICKVTRKALLVYEEKGLLTPFYVNEENGYRYYNAENISKIMHIRRFQSFGFSLDEIYDYLNDTKELSAVYDRLVKLKNDLEESINQLQMRMMTEEYDKQDIVRVIFPRSYCYAKRAATRQYSEALNFLRDTHIEAMKTDRTTKTAKMYTSV